MIKLKQILTETTIQFDNWVTPNLDSLKHEYDVEYKKHLIDEYGDIWPTFKDFLNATKSGNIRRIDSLVDNRIENRSHTETYRELVQLLSGYRSWPKYRNEDTLKQLYNRFKQNKTMDLPIVLENEDGYYRIMSGNTRLDIAFQLGIKPKILVVKIDD